MEQGQSPFWLHTFAIIHIENITEVIHEYVAY